MIRKIASLCNNHGQNRLHVEENVSKVARLGSRPRKWLFCGVACSWLEHQTLPPSATSSLGWSMQR